MKKGKILKSLIFVLIAGGLTACTEMTPEQKAAFYRRNQEIELAKIKAEAACNANPACVAERWQQEAAQQEFWRQRKESSKSKTINCTTTSYGSADNPTLDTSCSQ